MSAEPLFLLNKPLFAAVPLPGWVYLVVPAAVYLVLLFVVFPATMPRTVGAVRSYATWRRRHNLALGWFSLAVSVWAGLEAFWEAQDYLKKNAGKPAGFTTLYEHFTCNKETHAMFIVNAVFIVSKSWEFLDSAFIVWLKNDGARAVLADKKRVAFADDAQPVKLQYSMPEFLHAYHHLTTTAAFLLVVNLPGGQKLGVLLNGAIHAVMYLSYAGTIKLGPFKPLLTLGQIVQFAIVITMWFQAPAMRACKSFGFDLYPQTHFAEFYLTMLFVPVYAWEFIRFFYRKYIGGGAKEKDE